MATMATPYSRGLLACLLLVLGITSSFAQDVLWREESFEAFSEGTLEDGGANTYISARGAIQLVNRWDYNNDGYIDLLLVGTHDHRQTLDASIYINDGHRLRDRALSLPTDGGHWGLIQDLNVDGRPDIVIANTNNGTVGDLDSFVYWGSDDGFTPRNRSEVPSIFAGRPAAADFDKDGILDLVFANGGSFVLHPGDEAFERGSFIYWGGTDGYRKDHRLELPTFNAKAAGAEDLDDDGWVDLVFANNFDGQSHETDSCIYGGGPEGFDVNGRTGLRTHEATHLRIYDVDGDALADPVLLDSRGLVAFRNAGSRSFEPVIIPDAKGAADFALADLNRDDRTDLILAGSPSRILWGSGRLRFEGEGSTELPTSKARGCETADLDGDGYPEVIFANHDDGSSYDIRSFVYWNGPDGFRPEVRQELLTSGANSVAVGDIDGDAREDLLFLNIAGGSADLTPSYIYLGDSQGQYSAARRVEIMASGANDGASADLDDDGYTDLVITQKLELAPSLLGLDASIEAETEQGIETQPVYWGGPELFVPPTTTYLPMFGSYGAAVADLDRDGYLDLVLSAYFRRPDAQTDVSRVFFGGPDGFSLKRSKDLEAPGAEPATIADFNRDGWLDLVFANRKTGTEEGSVLYFGGASGFSKDRSLILATANSTRSQAADLDADGWLELIFTNQIESGSQFTPTLIYWGSSGGFALQRRTELPTWGGYGCCVADFNQDGFLDISVPTYKGYHSRKSDSKIFWGSRLGHLRTQYTHLPTESGAECLAADLNHDGWTDLFLINHRHDGDTQAVGRPASHVTNSFLYWNGPGGFDYRPLEIPSAGVHSNNSVDYGNIYNRKLSWGYRSSAFEFGDAPPRSIHWESKTPFDSYVRFQIRTAITRGDLGNESWRGRQPRTQWFTKSGEAIEAIPEVHRWVQYRLELGIEKGTANPEVTAVEFRRE